MSNAFLCGHFLSKSVTLIDKILLKSGLLPYKNWQTTRHSFGTAWYFLLLTMYILISDFYDIATDPIQSGCQNLKRIGQKTIVMTFKFVFSLWNHLGNGNFNGAFYDGHKYVCLDDVEFENCLVYSFGIGTEISFETAMLRFGI